MKASARTPRVSVLLPVYNGERHLAQAVRSVLAQTFVDFELLAIDDGSTDRSAEVLAGFSDPRLRVARFPENRGLVAALNFGMRESSSEFVARMDADDVCVPRRFERQVAFLASHPDIALCGSWTRQFGDVSGINRLPAEARQIRARLFFEWAVDHPSTMMRRAFLERHALFYDEDYRYVEDFDFFIRAANCGNLANLPEVLLFTRAHAGQTTSVKREEQAQTEARLLSRQLRSLMPGASQAEENLHLQLLNGTIDAQDLPKGVEWMLRLEQANRTCARYDEHAFLRELRLQSYRLHSQLVEDGAAVLQSFRNSPLTSRCGREYAKLVTKFAIRRARTGLQRADSLLRRR